MKEKFLEMVKDVGIYVPIKFIHDDSPIKYDEWWGDKETFIENIFVKKGDEIKQGKPVGTVGSTGRSTGAHLDIRLNWFGTRLDPMTVLEIK